MAVIIDRRKNSKGKTLRNRGRFIDLHKRQIRDGVKDILDNSNITDVGKTRKVRVRPLSKPTFSTEPGSGDKKYILPGNKEYVKGDKERKSGGRGRGREGGDGEGNDDFEFTLTKEEFMEFVFDHLELPDMIKKTMKDTNQWAIQRAGFKITGTPNQMDYRRTMINSIGRRIALKRPSQEDIEELEDRIDKCSDTGELRKLEALLEVMQKKRAAIPYIDTFDVKYRNFDKQPKPRTSAVIFCLMDISYSMSEMDKMIAKSFFMLLNLFLHGKYDKVDIRFVSHHMRAKEVDEHEFFYSTESGGTYVSSAYELTNKIIKDEYNLNDWNIYVAQASDGDNAPGDYEHMNDELLKLLDACQYFAYIQTMSEDNMNNLYYGYTPRETGVWAHLSNMMPTQPKLNMKQCSTPQDVWTVFTELFAKGAKRDISV